MQTAISLCAPPVVSLYISILSLTALTRRILGTTSEDFASSPLHLSPRESRNFSNPLDSQPARTRMFPVDAGRPETNAQLTRQSQANPPPLPLRTPLPFPTTTTKRQTTKTTTPLPTNPTCAPPPPAPQTPPHRPSGPMPSTSNTTGARSPSTTMASRPPASPLSRTFCPTRRKRMRLSSTLFWPSPPSNSPPNRPLAS